MGLFLQTRPEGDVCPKVVRGRAPRVSFDAVLYLVLLRGHSIAETGVPSLLVSFLTGLPAP